MTPDTETISISTSRVANSGWCCAVLGGSRGDQGDVRELVGELEVYGSDSNDITLGMKTSSTCHTLLYLYDVYANSPLDMLL